MKVNWENIFNSCRVSAPWKFMYFHVPQIDSTQNFLFPQSLDENTLALVTTDRQTHGRGKGDRQWISAPHNFMGTFGLKFHKSTTLPLSTLSLLSGAVLLKSIKSIISSPHHYSLKWPNDVLVNHKKCAGILLHSRPPEVKIGFGINFNTAPQLHPQATWQAQALQSLEIHQPLDVQAWAQNFLDLFLNDLNQWKLGCDQAWRQVWKEYGLFHQKVKISDGYEVIPLDIGPQGELKIGGHPHKQALFFEELIS